MKVLLDGTQNGSMWREGGFLPYLSKGVRYAFPDDCSMENYDYHLFVITPMGVETVESAIKSADVEKVVFCVHPMDFKGYSDVSEPPPTDSIIQFSDKEKKRLNKVGELIRGKGGKYFPDIKTTVEFFNSLVE